VSKFGMKVPHLICDSHTSNLQGQTVKGQGYRDGRGHTVSAEPGGHTASLQIRCSVLRNYTMLRGGCVWR